ncbi:hypothetical protein Tco_0895349 [Tanacetum coccineum]|uniref:Uncharacterized protein n=1 Tax=Tanacetum coccineum TaxID=301880 RepID=A0ABQ5CH80_9ASTR
MADLKYRDEHNKVGFLEKPKGSADYHQVLDFLKSSHIRDSTKSGSWDQFGSSLATALICLTEGRKFNWYHSGGVLGHDKLQLCVSSELSCAEIDSQASDSKLTAVESDIQEEEEQDVDPLIKLAKAATTAAADLAVPTGGSNEDDIPPSSSTPSDCSLLGGSVHANPRDFHADLLGTGVNEDNFAARMVALIAERRRQFAAQRFQDKRNKPMTYAQQRDYMRTFVKKPKLRHTIYTTRLGQ